MNANNTIRTEHRACFLCQRLCLPHQIAQVPATTPEGKPIYLCTICQEGGAKWIEKAATRGGAFPAETGRKGCHASGTTSGDDDSDNDSDDVYGGADSVTDRTTTARTARPVRVEQVGFCAGLGWFCASLAMAIILVLVAVNAMKGAHL